MHFAKKNYLEWIRDWVLYHHRTHGVERVVLYDNSSNNKAELEKYLITLESKEANDLELGLVHWDFTYDPQDVAFTQVGQINHIYDWLGNDISWVLNIDIDEYIVNQTGAPLQTYLKKNTGILNLD